MQTATYLAVLGAFLAEEITDKAFTHVLHAKSFFVHKTHGVNHRSLLQDELALCDGIVWGVTETEDGGWVNDLGRKVSLISFALKQNVLTL